MTLNMQLYLLNLVNMHSYDDILDVSGSFPKKPAHSQIFLLLFHKSLIPIVVLCLNSVSLIFFVFFVYISYSYFSDICLLLSLRYISIP